MESPTFDYYRKESHFETTSYSQFNVFDCLQDKFDGNDKKWIDIEIELRDFAKNIDLTKCDKKQDAIGYIEKTFNQVREALCEYLEKIDYSSIDIQSVAIMALKAISGGRNCVIYNFNYTDLSRLYAYVGRTPLFTVHNIHGTLKEKSIVLGFENTPLKYPNLDFMIKYQSDSYNPPDDIRRDLEEAEEVLFFGHTLGSTDHSYFQRFFQREVDVLRTKQIPICIVTFDAKSRRLINREINNMTNDEADVLNINYIQTHGNMSQEDTCNFFKKLAKRTTPNIEISALR